MNLLYDPQNPHSRHYQLLLFHFTLTSGHILIFEFTVTSSPMMTLGPMTVPVSRIQESFIFVALSMIAPETAVFEPTSTLLNINEDNILELLPILQFEPMDV